METASNEQPVAAPDPWPPWIRGGVPKLEEAIDAVTRRIRSFENRDRCAMTVWMLPGTESIDYQTSGSHYELYTMRDARVVTVEIPARWASGIYSPVREGMSLRQAIDEYLSAEAVAPPAGRTLGESIQGLEVRFWAERQA